MKAINLILIGAFVFTCAAVFLIATSINKEKKSYTENIGKKIQYNIDSLTVIDYSMIMETYTLSNGVSVSKQLVENQLNDNK